MNTDQNQVVYIVDDDEGARDSVKALVRSMGVEALTFESAEDFLSYVEPSHAGCLVTEGIARRSAGVRLLRDDVVIHEGTLKTLKRFKDEVAEVQSGQECGMAFENYEDIRPGDVIEIFEREEVERTLA